MINNLCLFSQDKIKIDTLTYCYRNSGDEFVSIKKFVIINNEQKNYITWLVDDDLNSRSKKYLIHDYFIRKNGDFSLFSLMTDNVTVLDTVSYIDRTFLHRISPGEHFTYLSIVDNKRNDCKSIILVEENEIEEYLNIKLDGNLFFKSNSIVLFEQLKDVKLAE